MTQSRRTSKSSEVQLLDVSIIVPTFKEAENLPELIPVISRELANAQMTHEIIIVDDNSQDGSVEVIEKLSDDFPVRIIVRTHAKDLSSAVIDGFTQGQGKVLVCMDADLSHPPAKLPELVGAIANNGADFAIGSRYVPGGSTDSEWSFARWLNSKVATWMARPLTRVRDPMSGYFAIPSDKFNSADHLNPLGYKIGLELIVKAHVQRPVEVPIHFSDRKRGESKLRLRHQIQYLIHVLRLLKYRVFRRI